MVRFSVGAAGFAVGCVSSSSSIVGGPRLVNISIVVFAKYFLHFCIMHSLIWDYFTRFVRQRHDENSQVNYYKFNWIGSYYLYFWFIFVVFRAELSSHLLWVESQVYTAANLEGCEKCRLFTTSKAIRSTIDAIDVYDQMYPLKMLGIRCDMNMAITIMSTLCTVYISVLQFTSTAVSTTSTSSSNSTVAWNIIIINFVFALTIKSYS